MTESLYNTMSKESLIDALHKLKDEVKDLETANQSWKDEQAKNVKTILGLEEHVNYLHKIYNNKLNK